jgi:hypothetical protein
MFEYADPSMVEVAYELYLYCCLLSGLVWLVVAVRAALA